MEHAMLQAAAYDLGEETFNRIGPGRRGGGEVEGPAQMTCQPGPDFCGACGCRSCRARHGSACRRGCRARGLRKRRNSWCRWRCMHTDDRAVENVERCEQGWLCPPPSRGPAIPNVVVRHCAARPRLIGKPGCVWSNAQIGSSRYDPTRGNNISGLRRARG